MTIRSDDPVAGTRVLTLRNAGWKCVVAPDLGGALLSLTRNGADLLRPTPAGADDPLQTACFALVPFANRIRDGAFAFAGEAVRLPADAAAAPHAHHGHGWRRAWDVADVGAGHVRLVLDVAVGTWPWAYRAEQAIALADEALEIALRVTNRSDRPMPVGVGLHPYFPRDADSAIAATAHATWRNDATGVAIDRHADARFAAQAPVPVAMLEGVDNFFEGRADVVLSGGPVPLRLRGTPAAGFHVYAPRGEDFLCVEPVSHAPGSFGRGDFTDGDVVAAGASREWSFRLDAQTGR